MRRFSLVAAMVLAAACGSKESGADPAAAALAEEQAAPSTQEAAPSPEAAVEVAQNEAVAATAAPVTPATAPAQQWALDRGASRIEFTGSQTGKEFSGSFSVFDVSIAFDPDNLDASHIKATIDTASAATGDRQRDDALPTSDWFSSSSFPTAVFESSDIRAAGRAYEARGRLTLRGVSKDVALPFSLEIDGDRAVADGAVTLVRSDFGVGQGEFAGGEWVGLDVKVTLHIEANR